MDPKDIAKLVTEDIHTNNGTLFEQDIEEGLFDFLGKRKEKETETPADEPVRDISSGKSASEDWPESFTRISKAGSGEQMKDIVHPAIDSARNLMQLLSKITSETGNILVSLREESKDKFEGTYEAFDEVLDRLTQIHNFVANQMDGFYPGSAVYKRRNTTEEAPQRAAAEKKEAARTRRVGDPWRGGREYDAKEREELLNLDPARQKRKPPTQRQQWQREEMKSTTK